MPVRTVGTFLGAACLMLGAAVVPAWAGNITNYGTILLPGFSTGTFGGVGGTTMPTAITNTVFFNAQGIGNLDIEYVVADSGGLTEYFFTDNFLNNTGQPWTHFRFELGFGTGAGFVRSGAGDGLAFDTPDRVPAPTSSVFQALSHDEDVIGWTGGSVPTIGSVRFSLVVDVPDNLSSFHPGGLNRFTIRQAQNVIPEPSTLLLLGAGVAAMGAGRRRRLARNA